MSLQYNVGAAPPAGVKPEVIRPGIPEREKVIVCTVLSRPDFEPALDGEHTKRQAFLLSAPGSEADLLELRGMLVKKLSRPVGRERPLRFGKELLQALNPPGKLAEPARGFLAGRFCAFRFFEVPLGILDRGERGFERNGNLLPVDDGIKSLQPFREPRQPRHQGIAEAFVASCPLGFTGVRLNCPVRAPPLLQLLLERREDRLPLSVLVGLCPPAGNEMTDCPVDIREHLLLQGAGKTERDE